MIKIYLLDFSGADASSVDRSALPSSIRNYIEKTGNTLLKRERIFSYFLLSYAYEKEFSRTVPGIEKDKYGRPYFPGESIDFNLSHDGEIGAVILSDEGRVGIDIQLCKSEVSERLINKTESLYSENIADIIEAPKDIDAEIEILKYSEKDGFIYSEENTITTDSDIDFFSKWTRIEAISKADGGGVALFSKIDCDKDRFYLKTAKIIAKNKKSYALSIAVKLF